MSSSKPRIHISVKGRFHAFQLARALQNHDLLEKIVTTYPLSHARRYGLNTKLVKSLFFPHEIINQVWGRYAPSSIKKCFDPSDLLCRLFDYHSSLLLPREVDLLVAWSRSALRSIRKAKEFKIKTVLERGSSHILFAKNILEEEYELMGIKNFSVVHPKIVERELKEYELADYISIPSEFVLKTFVEQGIDAKKLIKTNYGVDLSHFYPHPKQDDQESYVSCI